MSGFLRFLSGDVSAMDEPPADPYSYRAGGSKGGFWEWLFS